MRFSSEERAAHVELWRESGLSRAGYCRQSGLRYSTFAQWVQRQEKGGRGAEVDAPSGADTQEAFVAVSMPERVVASSGGPVVRAELVGQGVTVLLDESCAPGQVAAVLEALARC